MYQSKLTKEQLAYNILYQLKHSEKTSVYDIIYDVLQAMEEKTKNA